jgi:hypothetical protein
MRAEFDKRNYLHHPKIIRASSNRLNIFYMVRKVDAHNGSLLKQAASEAEQAWKESGFFDRARDKIILSVSNNQSTQLGGLELSCLPVD